MVEKKQLNVRIPEELWDKISRSEQSNVEIVTEALELYFASQEQREDSIPDSLLLTHLQGEVEHLRGQVDTLQELLSREQALHLQTQQQIPAKAESFWQRVRWWKRG